MRNLPLNKVNPISDLKDMLNKSAESHPDKPAFLVKEVEGGQYIPISYAKYKNDVECLGTVLIDLGLKNNRIIIIAENRYEWAVSYLAIVNGTGIAVPIDKELPKNEIEDLVQRSEASCIIFSSKFEPLMKDIAKRNEKVKVLINMDAKENQEHVYSFSSLLQEGGILMSQGNRDFLDAVIDTKVMNIMLFTSGTTSTSKAVMLSHENIVSNLTNVAKMIVIKSNDIFFSFLPLHHTYECTCGFLLPIYSGTAIAYCEGLRYILKNLNESKATIMLSVPLIFENMYRKIWAQASKQKGLVVKMKIVLALSNLLRVFRINLTRVLFKKIHNTIGANIRLFISGGAAIDPLVARGFREFGIPFIQGYGLTECSPIVTVNRDIWYKDKSAGLPLENLIVKIVDPSTDGIGEIAVKGPNVMIGYYQNQEATDSVLKDEWFYTGDLGYFDKDGFLYITGRKKNVIVTKNGKNIFPEELETLLNRSPYIKESMVWGKTDEDGDIILCATIVYQKESIEELYPNASKEQIEKLIDGEIKEFNKKVPLYKNIRKITVREEELIKTTTAKIKRQCEIKN
jgi:long-chain acyl-CoA synthetase